MRNHNILTLLGSLDLVGIGIAIIVVGGVVGYCVESYFIIGSCLLLGLASVSLNKFKNNKSVTLANLPEFVFKSPSHAFEYICGYVSFDYDLMPGLVRKLFILDGLSHAEVECLYEDKIYIIENCFNLLGDRVKENDLVTCFDLEGKVVIGSLLAPKFNPNSCSWKVIATAKYFMEVDEIPIRHRKTPR